MGSKTSTVIGLLTSATCLFSSFNAWSYDPSVVPPMNGSRTNFVERRAGKVVSASIRFGVTNEGIYRISYGVLTNAGVSPSLLVGANMRLFCRTQEVAISVSSSGVWTVADSLLFVGAGYDGYYSATNVYWLGFDSASGGLRMATRAGAPFAGLTPVTSGRVTALHHEDYYFKDAYRWNDTSIDHWVDQYMSLNDSTQAFALATDNVVPGLQARFEAVMMGRGSVDAINPDHSTKVWINGNVVGQFDYDGEVTAVISTNFPAAWLMGVNTISFNQMVNSSDLAYIERFGITYSRSLIQSDNVLFFDGAPGSNTYRVSGFASNANFDVYETTDPARPVLLTGSQVTNMGGGVYAVLFGDNAAGTSRYAVCQMGGSRNLPSVQRTSFRDLASTNQQADYVVICPYNFRRHVYRLLTQRHLQGLSVAVAPLTDIYNEFSYGIADAAAIKQFIGYAFHHWKVRPRYILLAGSGSYNPRYHNEPHSPLMSDIIPVHLGPGNGVWCALDGWYAAVNDSDASPDIAIGRLPVVSATELRAIVDKIIAFEGVSSNDESRTKILMACDTNAPGYDFYGAADTLLEARVDTNAMDVTVVHGTNDSPRAEIVAILNSGMFLVNYFGHGNTIQWSSIPMLDTNDVRGLVNNVFPVVSMMTCVNGSFAGSKDKCLATWFLSVSNRGASACVAASGLASLNAAEPFMNGFYGALLGERRERIGDALLPAYSAISTNLGLNVTELQFFGLLGDPGMIINP